MADYVEPVKGRMYSASPIPPSHYHKTIMNFPGSYLSVTPHSKYALGGYDFSQNGAYAQMPNYQTQTNGAYTPLYLKRKQKSYAFAPAKDYKPVSGLPPTESQVQGIEAIIRNEAEILAERIKGLKKKAIPIAAAS